MNYVRGKNGHYECHLCKCQTGTIQDMDHHLKAHETFGKNPNDKTTYGKKLPSLGKTSKIDDLVALYDEYIQDHTRLGEKQNFRDAKLGETVFDYGCKPYRELVIKKMMENKRCEICNKRNPVVCHHIIPVMTAPHLGLVNSNIIAVCKPCHDKIHDEYKLSRQTYEDNNSIWIDYSEEMVHDCVQCGCSFYGPLYRNFCTTCYQHNKVDYY